MLYFVKINTTVIFKGDYYACLEYIDTIEIGQARLKIEEDDRMMMMKIDDEVKDER